LRRKVWANPEEFMTSLKFGCMAMAALVVVAGSAPAQQESTSAARGPYRWAVGVNPNQQSLLGSMGMSASKDVYNRHNRLVLRADATVLGGERRRGGAAITLDGVYGIPTFGRTVYGLAGAGAAAGVQVARVIGGGVDFALRNRPMFVEARSYRQGTNMGLLRIGVRY
jgi:hypothetical protein